MRIRYHLFILLTLLSYWTASGQDGHIDALAEIYDNDSFSRYQFVGYLEKSLPVVLVFGKEEDELKGFIFYGQNEERFDVEGTINSAGDIMLYEFDKYQRVTGKIHGNILNTTELFTWSSVNDHLNLSMLLYSNRAPEKLLSLFESTHANSRSQILLRADLQQITIDPLNDINLRWIDYLCDGTDCYENRPNVLLSNPVEFSLTKKENRQITVYPSHQYAEVQMMSYANQSTHDINGFLSINYPIANNKEFDSWVSTELLERRRERIEEEDEFIAISDRFSHRQYGDFYISLLSNDLISGYLFESNTSNNRVLTTPFIFDRNKSKFYTIKDLFSKDFNYSFFLEKYLEKVKRGRMIKENRMVQGLLKKEDYKHYILAPDGLLFFTDFNVIFGRRHILIPFEEIINSIDNRSLENYLKKERS